MKPNRRKFSPGKFLYLGIFSILCGSLSLGADVPACLHQEIQKPAPGVGQTPDSYRLVLTNNCGKHITAFGVWVFDSDGVRKSGFAVDNLLTVTAVWPNGSGPDIFRDGTKLVEGGQPIPPGGTTAVVAVLFLDGTSAGNPVDVARIYQSRRRSLGELKERNGLLNNIKDWPSSALISDRIEKTSEGRSSEHAYLQQLLEKHFKSDAVEWKKFVSEEQLRTMKQISLLEKNLGESLAEDN